MRRIVVLGLAVAIGNVVVPTAARADTPDCVSRHEYSRVTTGMTLAKVHRIFDIEGVVTGLGAPNELRYYSTCTGRGVIQVIFNPRGRVVGKDGRFF